MISIPNNASLKSLLLRVCYPMYVNFEERGKWRIEKRTLDELVSQLLLIKS